ncbi:CYTH and CHAD domain-containing protein [Bradyrhizobium sp. CB3481]|uniref:CYTH and CHAD domain-containing protein n=1 Tax=Bradyrhizobium sp. CB3481 TaxID=3039158 RepID=UPI0024B14D49|nr:CYTH and CHAD domain-containing protein [Bradyrhizobium sp. CB3481]WFU18380.1 CHAD domain-containing protein [Bradyrhizobium sp. CB3481]
MATPSHERIQNSQFCVIRPSTDEKNQMGVETEVKFRVPRRNIAALAHLKIPGSRMAERSESDLTSTYFDTRKRKLKRHGLVLRVRQTGGKYIQTIKKVSAGLDRGEWETEIKDGSPDLGEADGTPLEEIASKKLRRKLRPVFKTSVRRITLPIRSKGSEIELAVDRGEITVRGRSSRIEEIELELKRGRPRDLFQLARAVERKLDAELYLRGKAERGYDLVDSTDQGPVFAGPIELNEQMSAIEGFKAIAHAALRHFSGNIDAVRNFDPEGVHQMRVGLRRLRAAISLFSKVLTGTKTGQIKAELKWLTNQLAPAREIDVFLHEKVEPVAPKINPRRGAKAIEREFADRRHQALERATSAVNSGRCRAMLVELLEWIEAQDDGGDEAKLEISKFATDLLNRRVKKVRKDGRILQDMSPMDRHKLRIRVKKIRYAMEFFESLFPGKRERKQLVRLSRHLKKIQGALGSLNDFIADSKMAADAALHAPPQNRRARAFASGFIVGHEAEQTKPLMKAASKEVRALRACALG